MTNGFKEVVADLKDERVQYREFDFHNECEPARALTLSAFSSANTLNTGKGMHYENISKLIHDVDSTFDEQGCAAFVQLDTYTALTLMRPLVITGHAKAY